MSKWLHAVILVTTLIAATGAQAVDKIAVVNVGTLVEHIPQRQQAIKKLELEMKNNAMGIQEIERRLNEKQKKSHRDAATMSKGEQKALSQEISQLQEQYVMEMESFQKDLHKKQAMITEDCLQKIRQAVQVVIKKMGYTLVLSSDAVVYATNTNDITKEVLVILKK